MFKGQLGVRLGMAGSFTFSDAQGRELKTIHITHCDMPLGDVTLQAQPLPQPVDLNQEPANGTVDRQ